MSLLEKFNREREEGRIEEAVSIYRDEFKLDDSSIIGKLCSKFSISTDIAKSYVAGCTI